MTKCGFSLGTNTTLYTRVFMHHKIHILLLTLHGTHDLIHHLHINQIKNMSYIVKHIYCMLHIVYNHWVINLILYGMTNSHEVCAVWLNTDPFPVK